MKNLTPFNFRNLAFVLDNPRGALKLKRTYKGLHTRGNLRMLHLWVEMPVDLDQPRQILF